MVSWRVKVMERVIGELLKHLNTTPKERGQVDTIPLAALRDFKDASGTKDSKENLLEGDSLIVRPTLVTVVSYMLKKSSEK